MIEYPWCSTEKKCIVIHQIYMKRIFDTQCVAIFNVHVDIEHTPNGPFVSKKKKIISKNMLIEAEIWCARHSQSKKNTVSNERVAIRIFYA